MTDLPATGHPDLTGKVALVTGASRGIGAAASRCLAAAGATVVLAARDLPSSQQIADDIVADGHRAEAVQLDVGDAKEVADVVDHIETTYGALDLAFNNAGTQGPARPLHEQTVDEMRRIIDVNLMGVFNCLKYEIPAMLRAGSGVILNTASVGGVVGAPGIGPYCASKHAVVGLSRSAAADYGRSGIRINVLAPGSVRTDILTNWLDEDGALEHMESVTPMGRIAEADEMAMSVAWLLSDASSFMTGSVVTSDGGYTSL